MKIILTIVIIALSFNALCQTAFEKAYKEGFNKGYCQQNEIKTIPCYPPPPQPMSIAVTAHNKDDVQAGYNHGFQKGTQVWNSEQEQKRLQQYQQQQQQKEQQRDQKQEQLQQNIENYEEQRAADKQAQEEQRIERQQKQKQQYQQQQQQQQQLQLQKQQQASQQYQMLQQTEILKTKELYKSFEKYPREISDGWHSVKLIEGNKVIVDAKVEVKANKVNNLALDNWILCDVTLSGNIENGKTYVRFNAKGVNSELSELYFIENIVDPETKTTKPLAPGKLTLWSTNKKAKKAKVYLGNQYLGNFKKRFKNDSKISCNENGSITITYKPGSYIVTVVYQGFFRVTKSKHLVILKENECNIYEVK